MNAVYVCLQRTVVLRAIDWLEQKDVVCIQC